VSGQLGLEPTPEEFLEKMVAVFREVRRILRKDGTLWLNIGDSYAGSGGNHKENHKRNKPTAQQEAGSMAKQNIPGLKPKDLCMMPHRLAMALQKDGWWIRSDIVWHKPNPMPEPCTDRPTKSHEYIFLCTKSAKYYYDAAAIREENVTESNAGRPRMGQGQNTQYKQKRGEHKNLQEKGQSVHSIHVNRAAGKGEPITAGRNKRSVWTIPTQAFAEAHSATFPEKLVEPCIKAGTSEKGCCPECGAPWVRITEKPKPPSKDTRTPGKHTPTSDKKMRGAKLQEWLNKNPTKTIGWQPGCKCGKEPVPCLVYDLFFGSGTVGLVAYKLGRHYSGSELNPEYVKIAEKRIQAEKDKYGLLEKV